MSGRNFANCLQQTFHPIFFCLWEHRLFNIDVFIQGTVAYWVSALSQDWCIGVKKAAYLRVKNGNASSAFADANISLVSRLKTPILRIWLLSIRLNEDFKHNFFFFSNFIWSSIPPIEFSSELSFIFHIFCSFGLGVNFWQVMYWECPIIEVVVFYGIKLKQA